MWLHRIWVRTHIVDEITTQLIFWMRLRHTQILNAIITHFTFWMRLLHTIYSDGDDYTLRLRVTTRHFLENEWVPTLWTRDYYANTLWMRLLHTQSENHCTLLRCLNNVSRWLIHISGGGKVMCSDSHNKVCSTLSRNAIV